MVVELKDRIPPREVQIGRKQPLPAQDKQIYFEALSALSNLGYSRKDSEKAIEGALEKQGDARELRLETLLTNALRLLAK